MQKTPTNRKILALMQILIGVALISLLVWQLDDREKLITNWKTALRAPRWIAAAIAFLGCSLFTTALRWHTLVHTGESSLTLREATSITLSGHLFNLLLPGATGGDVVRAACASRASEQNKAEVAATVLLDRLVGVLSIILLTNVVVLLRLPLFLSSTLLTWVAIGFAGMLVAGVLGTALLLGVNHLERFPKLRKRLESSKIGGLIARGYVALHIATRNPRAMLTAVTLSIICQLLQVSCAWCMGQAIGIALQWRDYAATVPVVNTAAIIPLSPGGIGLREAVTQALFRPMGVADEASTSMSLLVYGCMLIWALVGAIRLLWITVRKRPAADSSSR